MSAVHVIDHPLVQHKLTLMRDERINSKDFRELLNEMTVLIGYEVTRDLSISQIEVKTPITTGTFPTLANQRFTIVPVLRAGLGMQAGMLQLLPFAHIGIIGLYRQEKPDGGIEVVEYYCKMPADIAESYVIVVDPMLATGTSANTTLASLEEHGCKDIRFMCIVAAPEGVAAVQREHPNVDIYTASIDDHLDEHDYIVPGLGDAGDRIFGTR